jgi:nitrogenase molybdenum-iron protein alpha/beta subunit
MDLLDFTLSTISTLPETAVLFCVDITQSNCNCQRMAAKTRKPLGWAKEKVGRQLIAHEFIGRREMQEALRAFEEHRGIIREPFYASKLRIKAESKQVDAI